MRAICNDACVHVRFRYPPLKMIPQRAYHPRNYRTHWRELARLKLARFAALLHVNEARSITSITKIYPRRYSIRLVSISLCFNVAIRGFRQTCRVVSRSCLFAGLINKSRWAPIICFSSLENFKYFSLTFVSWN